jgi:hypothetical protein
MAGTYVNHTPPGARDLKIGILTGQWLLYLFIYLVSYKYFNNIQLIYFSISVCELTDII